MWESIGFVQATLIRKLWKSYNTTPHNRVEESEKGFHLEVLPFGADQFPSEYGLRQWSWDSYPDRLKCDVNQQYFKSKSHCSSMLWKRNNQKLKLQKKNQKISATISRFPFDAEKDLHIIEYRSSYFNFFFLRLVF